MSTDSVLDFLDDRTLSGRRPGTVARYRSVLDRLEDDLNKDPVSVTRTEIRRYLAGWQTEHSLNGAAFVLRHLRAFYTWAVREGYIAEDPTVGVSIRPKAEPMLTATDDEISALLGFKGRKHKDIRDRAMLHLLVCTGARRSELGALSVGDLLLDDRLVTIPRSKTIARYVPITDEAAIHLRQWLRVRPPRGTNLWMSSDGPALVGRVIGRRSAGTLSPHSIRRWFATSWLSNGGSETSLARILGWTTSAMAAVYTRATAQQVAHAEYRRVFCGRPGLR